MKGEHAFCPRTGAPLSNEVHYDEFGRPVRHATRDGHAAKTQPEGELTNGALRSSRIAIFNYFRRCHRRQHGHDEALYSDASLALMRLKQTASGTASWDINVWYALGERLVRSGHDVQWMTAYVGLRCPDCSGRLKFERAGESGVRARCGVDCSGDEADRLDEIRETVADLYSRAFHDAETVDADELRLL